ncbi:MAG: glycosyltransferase family 2 protein [Proteobacteria bacterium]|nr:glycosyltransferase family 2 protein [Pseudomonadota bacterium]
MKQKLTIIIVTFNSAKIIKSCLERLNLEKYKVVVVDNASHDDTTQIVKKHFPKVEIIKLDKNLGYGRANNVALRQTKTPYALILNPDAFIGERDIEKVLEVTDKYDDVALAAPMLYHCKLENNKLTKPIKDERYIQPKYPENPDSYFASFLIGAALFMKMDLMKKIGFFDEGFFLFGEDNELCKRVIKRGYKNLIVKNAKLRHISGGSTQVSNPNIYWHGYGWSKLYYTQLLHGVVIAKLKALRMIIKSSIAIAKDALLGRKISMKNKYALLGSYGYLIGLKAFKKDGNPRI